MCGTRVRWVNILTEHRVFQFTKGTPWPTPNPVSEMRRTIEARAVVRTIVSRIRCWNIRSTQENMSVMHPKEIPGLYLVKGKMSYRQISWSLEATRFRFRLSNHSEIRQQRCRDACQIPERYDYSNIQSWGFETSPDLAVRRPTA